MKAFSGADLTVYTTGTHSLTQQEPLRKRSVGRVCPVPLRKPGWNGTSQQVYDLADISVYAPVKQHGSVTKMA